MGDTHDELAARVRKTLMVERTETWRLFGGTEFHGTRTEMRARLEQLYQEQEVIREQTREEELRRWNRK